MAPLMVSMILAGPTLRPPEQTRTSLVGVKTSFVFSGDNEMSVRLPVTVAAEAGRVENVERATNIEHPTLNIER